MPQRIYDAESAQAKNTSLPGLLPLLQTPSLKPPTASAEEATLEDRLACKVAHRPDRFDQLLERQFLVLESSQP